MNLTNVGILIICLLIIYYLVRKYLEFVEKQRKNPVFIRDPINAKKPLLRNREDIPLPRNGNGYTLSVWLWIDDYEYLKGEWKHILHKGDRGAEQCQPSMWLHPKENKLYVFFDSDERKYNYKEIVKDKMLNTHLPKLNYYSAIHGTKLGELKKECNINPLCASISVVCKDEKYDDNNICKYGILNLTDSTRDDLFFKYEDEHKKEYDNYKFIGTMDKLSEASSMNPNKNMTLLDDVDLYQSVENIPLGRWFNFVLVIEARASSIYIDGKLKNTKVLSSNIKQNNGDLYVTNCGGYSGLLTQLRYFEKSLSYKEVMNIYRWGPNPWQWPEFLLLNGNSKKKLIKDRKRIDETKKFLCKEGTTSDTDITEVKFTCDNIKGISNENSIPKKKYPCDPEGYSRWKDKVKPGPCEKKNCSKKECCIEKKSCNNPYSHNLGIIFQCRPGFNNTGAYCKGSECTEEECCTREETCMTADIKCDEGMRIIPKKCGTSIVGCTKKICCADQYSPPAAKDSDSGESSGEQSTESPVTTKSSTA